MVNTHLQGNIQKHFFPHLDYFQQKFKRMFMGSSTVPVKHYQDFCIINRRNNLENPTDLRGNNRGEEIKRFFLIRLLLRYPGQFLPIRPLTLTTPRRPHSLVRQLRHTLHVPSASYPPLSHYTQLIHTLD